MRVPFQISPERMQDHDEARREVPGLIHLEKHPGNNTGDSMEKAVQKRTVFKEIMTQIIVNGEDTMSVFHIDQFERHTGGALHGILISTGGAEAAVTAKSDKFQFSASRTAIHYAPIRGVATVNHLLDIFLNGSTRMKSMDDFFIMIREYFL